ncbi:stage II sporulation protein M [Chakrabartyella piscis]|uniref:stage II sporulation protein M n=1 Tax=Chakrabartyella piscis TaxID=2918914 RepID=UPI00295875B1|nr:stage II sporulation protein M [Chakrabartyella piscis]
MVQKKLRKSYTQMLKLLYSVCGIFLCGIAIGAVFANYVGIGWLSDMGVILEEGTETGTLQSYGEIFWKYGKYQLLIWLGGWRPIGMVVSGSAFLFRGISLGFCSAMILLTYGVGGIWLVIVSYLPQNLILIPAYIAMMCVAIFYTTKLSRNTTIHKRKQTINGTHMEYILLLLLSFIPIAIGVGIERLLCCN